ncbi:MAG: bifunctional 3,4-dihydroxy-2-butanone-4-phosphate synthase/GTP cyclohydrolase II, partial [Deltaproteobacteria bacterium]
EGEPFQAYVYGTSVEDAEYLALVRGDVRAASRRGEAVLVRVQAADPVGDAFGVGPYEPQLRGALRAIDEAGLGVFLYVYPKPRLSLLDSFERHVLRKPAETRAHRAGPSEVLRDFGLGAQVLADLGCRKIRLMSNNPRRIAGLEGFGIEIVERVPIAVDPHPVGHLQAVRGDGT